MPIRAAVTVAAASRNREIATAAHHPHVSASMAIREFLRLLPFERFQHPPPVVAVLRLHGVIGLTGRRGLSLANRAAAIERAFGLRDLAAVALQINSPGGSPVQSALLESRIRQLADEKNVPVFA